MPDWTVATDDLLCQRWGRCFLCGARQGQMEMGLHETTSGITVATLTCLYCLRQPHARAQLQALLAERYGTTRSPDQSPR